MRSFLLVVSFVLLLSPCVIAQPYSVRPPVDADDYSTITAIVLNVDQLAFPRARVRLSITGSTNARILSFIRGSRIIVADNYLWRTLGRTDCADRRNLGAVAAYYLLPGDEIRAKLFTDRNLEPRWYIYGIARIPRGLSRPTLGDVKAYDGLELALDIERAVYSLGQPVAMTLSVTNTSNTRKTLTFPSGQRYDFVITRAGREVWRWSAGMAFTQALGSLVLAPGETIRYRGNWPQEDNQGRQVEAGEYAITGILTSSDPPRPSAGPVSVIVERRRQPGVVFD